jgi:hypothetical protein
LTPARQAWYDAVDAVVTTAKAKLPPECGSRIDRARELVLAGHVELCEDGTARVTSQTDGQTTYLLVNGTCSCEDFPHAPEGLCKHRAAARIARRAIRVATQGAPEPPPLPVPPNGPPAPPGPGSPNGTGPRPTPSADPVTAAQTDAERNCRAAVESTPPPYRGYIQFLPRRKKVGGTRERPLYAEIAEPYMTVNGRVRMAMDEHREAGAILAIHTTFALEEHSGHLLCRAHVTSPLRGSATAHARVFLGATSGVDFSNPCENAETSAVGRALGFLAYGLVGSGIASAEEVQLAQAMRPGAPDDLPAAEPSPVGPTRPGQKPPTARQQTLLQDLLREAGVPEEAIPEHLAQISTSWEASARIDQLRSQLRPYEA